MKTCLTTICLLLLSCGSSSHSRFYILKETPYRYGDTEFIAKKMYHTPVQLHSSLGSLSSALTDVHQKLNAALDRRTNLTKRVDFDYSKEGQPKIYTGIQDINVTQRYIQNDPLEQNQKPVMIMNITEGSENWKAQMSQKMKAASISFLIIPFLSKSKYWVIEDDFMGKKRLELGAKNHMELPISTNKNEAIEIIQLNSVLINNKGEIVRVISEGISPNYTMTNENLAQVKAKITDHFCRKLSSLIDEKNSDQPLRWERSLNNMLAQIIGRKDLLQ